MGLEQDWEIVVKEQSYPPNESLDKITERLMGHLLPEKGKCPKGYEGPTVDVTGPDDGYLEQELNLSGVAGEEREVELDIKCAEVRIYSIECEN